MNRSRLMLALLLPLLIAAVISAWLRMPRQKRVDRLTFRQLSTVSGQPAAGPQERGGEGRDDLQGGMPVAGVHRNIFRPLVKEQAAAAGQGRAAAPHRSTVAAPPPPPPPTPQELARQHLDAFTVLGSYAGKGARIVFLAKAGEIITVRVGDMPIPGYRVIAIDEERMTLRSQDGSHQLVTML